MHDRDIHQVINRQEALNLLNRCAKAVHGKHWQALTECCHGNVSISGLDDRILEGFESVVAAYDRCLRGLAPSESVDGLVYVEILGNSAIASTTMQAAHADIARSDRCLVGFSYRDCLRRTPDGWRLEHRRMVATWRTLGATLDRAGGLRL